MRTLIRLFVAVVSGFLFLACSVTRHIPEGTYLLNKVKIEQDKTSPRKERISADELEKFVRQTPNKRFLGTNVYAWIYTQADSSKHNWWNNLKRRIGKEPVLLNMDYTRKSAENLKIYMDTRGFFSSTASFEVDTTSRRKRAKVIYRTRQGEPYRIREIEYEFRDKFLEPILLPDTANSFVRRGEVFDITVLDRERERITAFLKDRGYFNFSVGNIAYEADTLGGNHLVDVRVVIKQYLAGYDARGQAIMENNTVYRIDRINVLPNYNPTVFNSDSTIIERLDTVYYRGLNVVYEQKPNLRKAILRQSIPLYPNYVYSASQVSRTYSELMSLGYFRSARVSFTELPPSSDSTSYVSYVSAPADSTQQASLTREGYLECNILCTPALKQSFKIDLTGSTTSSFYGLQVTFGYQNRNIFRGAESFDVSLTTGYEFMKAPDAKKKTAWEIGVNTSLTFPRFLIPWRTRRFESVNQPKTKVELSVNYQDRPFYRRTLSSAAIAYMWTNNKYSSFTLRPIDINVVDVSYVDPDFLASTDNRYLRESFQTQFIGGIQFSYGYNNQMKNLGRNATNIRFNFETAGNLIDGVERLFYSKPKGLDYYTIFGIRYAQYFRTDLSVSRKIMLGASTALVGRIYGGVAMAYGNSAAVPFDREFYSGGANSMRGWTPRTLGQGTVPAPDDTFPMQIGDVKLEANLELRFPIWGMFHGATFLDAGNIWYIRSSDDYSPEAVFKFNNFYRQLAFNTGIGLRLDIKFAVLRLDWGIQLHSPNRPAGERWIHNFKWKNTALNFGVGYPF